MDSLTHLVLGHAMGAFAGGATPAAAAGAYWGALVGNSLPDIDVPVGYLLRRGWAFHRKFTHTIPGMVLLSAGATLVITLAIPGSDPRLTLAYTLAGCLIHVLLDCLNLFGTRPFWPFSTRSIGAGTLFIMDPVMLGVLGLGSMLELTGQMTAATLRGLYIAVAVYVVLRRLTQIRLRAYVSGPGVMRASVFAWLASWRYLRETPTLVELGKLNPLTGRATMLASYEKAQGPVVDATRQLPQVRAFLGQARYPFAQVHSAGPGYRVVWQDLYARLRGRNHAAEVLLDENLHPYE